MKCPKCQKDMEIMSDGAYCLDWFIKGACPQKPLGTHDLAKMIDELNDKIDSLNEQISWMEEDHE